MVKVESVWTARQRERAAGRVAGILRLGHSPSLRMTGVCGSSWQQRTEVLFFSVPARGAGPTRKCRSGLVPEGIADAGRLEGGGSRFRGAVRFSGLGVMARRRRKILARAAAGIQG